MKKYIEITVAVKDESDSVLLVAAVDELDFEGIEEKEGSVHIFFNEEKLDRLQLTAILSDLGHVFEEKIYEDQNWNHEWESGFTPVVIDDYAAIRANFHQPVKGVEHEIVITPKMSFGTGHHATTSLMIRLMRELEITRKTVLDFGTGTGILAILAIKSGAARVMAIDNDEWSINNAKENFKENNAEAIRLICADTLPAGELFDVILANINLNVLSATVDEVKSISHTGSKILLSGFYKQDVDVILSVYKREHFKLVEQREQDNWSCLLLEKL